MDDPLGDHFISWDLGYSEMYEAFKSFDHTNWTLQFRGTTEYFSLTVKLQQVALWQVQPAVSAMYGACWH